MEKQQIGNNFFIPMPVVLVGTQVKGTENFMAVGRDEIRMPFRCKTLREVEDPCRLLRHLARRPVHSTRLHPALPLMLGHDRRYCGTAGPLPQARGAALP